MAWVWLLAGAGMEMKPLVSLAPMSGDDVHASGMMMAQPMSWPVEHFALIFSMWWVMMAAMMLPSAAPMILLYARAAMNAQNMVQPASGSFLAGYLLSWGAFSLAATILQLLLEQVGLLMPMFMASQSRWLSAAILISAGIYQLSPLKNVCLRHCRNPAQFLSSHFRPGPNGALRMGLLHGIYCVGCCWLLMVLLFVGGVMNLAWIALLTLMVAAEKLLPFGRYVSIAAGVACISWGMVMLFG
ncbi:DUF2182 domain-containing protein [Rhizorhapis sp. SPR117]|nr:DUF2182 domain-containing protein [Rhizorhapis sp. SPR117]